MPRRSPHPCRSGFDVNYRLKATTQARQKSLNLRLRSSLAVLLDRPSCCLQSLAGWRRRNSGEKYVALGTLRVFSFRKCPHRFGPDDVVHGRGNIRSTATRVTHKDPPNQVDSDDGVALRLHHRGTRGAVPDGVTVSLESAPLRPLSGYFKGVLREGAGDRIITRHIAAP